MKRKSKRRIPQVCFPPFSLKYPSRIKVCSHIILRIHGFHFIIMYPQILKLRSATRNQYLMWMMSSTLILNEWNELSVYFNSCYFQSVIMTHRYDDSSRRKVKREESSSVPSTISFFLSFSLFLSLIDSFCRPSTNKESQEASTPSIPSK